MAISEEKMKIVINNYFKAECDVNTSIRNAFEKGFRIGVNKGGSAQPKPERKNGKWLQKEDPFGFFEEIPVCSECGHTTEMRRTYNFCPHCGARMEVEEK